MKPGDLVRISWNYPYFQLQKETIFGILLEYKELESNEHDPITNKIANVTVLNHEGPHYYNLILDRWKFEVISEDW